MRTAVVIPARDEEGCIGEVVRRLPNGLGGPVVVVDNGSRDATAEEARRAGAIVVAEARPGYGHACRAGLTAAADSDIVVFLDGDGSMLPEDIPRLLQPIIDDRADIVCGIRRVSRATMPWHQRTGNIVIALLLRIIWGVRIRELGPFRAVRTTSLQGLDMPPSRFAWPAQMLARAARQKLRITSVSVGYGARLAGHSKVGGSVRGSMLATWDIIHTIVRERLRA